MCEHMCLCVCACVAVLRLKNNGGTEALNLILLLYSGDNGSSRNNQNFGSHGAQSNQIIFKSQKN